MAATTDSPFKLPWIVQTAGKCRLIFWHVISKCFSLRRIISFLQRYRKTSNFRKSIVRNNNISKKWSNGIKTFGPMTRAGMNFDRLACWRNDPSALIKWSNETVRIVSSWRHVKYFGKLKWDRVHSMLIHLSGSTAAHEKPYMSPQVSSMKCDVGLWRKFTVWKHLFSSRRMYIASRVFRVQFWQWGWMC